MVLVTISTDELQELLKAWHFDHSITAKGIEAVLGEPSFAHISRDTAAQIIGRNAAIREWPGTDPADNGSVRVLLADRTSNDFLVVHFLLGEERFRQIRTVEDDALIWIGAEVIVPIEQRRRNT